MLVSTLYSNRDEFNKDLNMFGKIVSAPQQSIDELRNTLYEEFKRLKPPRPLEHIRYKLSREARKCDSRSEEHTSELQSPS